MAHFHILRGEGGRRGGEVNSVDLNGEGLGGGGVIGIADGVNKGRGVAAKKARENHTKKTFKRACDCGHFVAGLHVAQGRSHLEAAL